MPKRLFRVIVGGWYAAAPQEGKEKFLFGSCEESPEGFGGFETERLFADMVQFLGEAFFKRGRRLPGDIAGFDFLPHLAVIRGVRDCLIALSPSSLFFQSCNRPGDAGRGHTNVPRYLCHR